MSSVMFTMVCLLVADTLVYEFQKLKLTQNKRRSTLFIRETREEWPDWFKLTASQYQLK